MATGGPRVVVVHDYVTQRGGAERVTLDLLAAFPGARLVTSVWEPASSFDGFAEYEVETLALNRIASFRRDPRLAFPLLASAFRRHAVDDADVVICSSSGWAHRVGTTAPKIVYCHNPARWLYQPDDYFAGYPRSVRRAASALLGPLRRSDAEAARSAQCYLANSSVVARRVRETYGIEAQVVPPARGLSPDGPQEPVPGLTPGFLLTVGRSRGYKNTGVVIDAVAGLPDERLLVVGGADSPHPNVIGVRDVTDAQLRWLYANAAGLVAVAYEDFGLTPVEAQAFGLPAVLLRAGGYLDSAVEGETGVFVDEPTDVNVRDGIDRLRRRTWNAAAIREHGKRYSVEAFASAMQQTVGKALATASP